MALTHLMDTSVLKRLGSAPVREVIDAMADAGALARSDFTDLEVGFSARNAKEWDAFMESLNHFDLVETTAPTVVRARAVQRLLAAKSQRGRKIVDLVIAAAAEQRGLIVLHYDADFDAIAKVTGQPTQWVVPPGTVP